MYVRIRCIGVYVMIGHLPLAVFVQMRVTLDAVLFHQKLHPLVKRCGHRRRLFPQQHVEGIVGRQAHDVLGAGRRIATFTVRTIGHAICKQSRVNVFVRQNTFERRIFQLFENETRIRGTYFENEYTRLKILCRFVGYIIFNLGNNQNSLGISYLGRYRFRRCIPFPNGLNSFALPTRRRIHNRTCRWPKRNFHDCHNRYRNPLEKHKTERLSTYI